MPVAGRHDVRGMCSNCCATSSKLPRYSKTCVGTAAGPLCEAVLNGKINDAPSAVAGNATEVRSLVG